MILKVGEMSKFPVLFIFLYVESLTQTKGILETEGKEEVQSKTFFIVLLLFLIKQFLWDYLLFDKEMKNGQETSAVKYMESPI